MSMDLLYALQHLELVKGHGDPPFQHKLCHDFESLIWVIVYAMMIRRKNTLALTDSRAHKEFKKYLNSFWGAHSYSSLLSCRWDLIVAGCRRSRKIVDDFLLPGILEAKFFRDAMRLVSFEDEPLTYEKIHNLFQTYIQQAEKAKFCILADA